jgi:DamX protein
VVAKEKAPTKTNYTSDEQQILAANPRTYAIQLAGSTKLNSLKRHFNATAIASKVKYFHTILNGKAWYVAIYGQYPSANAAQAAIKTLPTGIAQNNPWPRSYASMQAAIKVRQ